jgi:uncharacterized protein (DUF2267 family)
MSEPFEKAGQDAAAFQKLCLENFTKAMEVVFKFTPDTAPPDALRQMRAGVFEALARSWDEYMRSPQFLDAMRQWMDNAVAFRKISNEFLGRVRNEVQAPSSSDIDTVMLAVRHMEKRFLDRLDEMSTHLERLDGHGAAAARRTPGKPREASAAPARPKKGRRT